MTETRGTAARRSPVTSVRDTRSAGRSKIAPPLTVVIENQLERSDHDHLGKLVTYVAALGAPLGVWIVADPRPEHIGAVNWLNEAGTAAFFLLKLEAVRIGESAPAPLLTLITGPSEEALEVGETKKELAARHIERQAFWRALLSTVKSRRTHLFSAVSPSDRPWISTGAGKGGMLYHFRTRPEDSAVECAVERPSPEENDAAFEQLQQHKDKIESAYGGHLQWRQRGSRRRAVAISETFEGGYRSPDRWPELHSRMIDAVIRLDEALKPFVETPTAST